MGDKCKELFSLVVTKFGRHMFSLDDDPPSLFLSWHADRPTMQVIIREAAMLHIVGIKEEDGSRIYEILFLHPNKTKGSLSQPPQAAPP